MIISNLNTATKVPFDLDGKILYSDKRTEMIHLTLKPEEILEKHTNSFDVIFYVLDGKGLLITDENTDMYERNTSIFLKKNVMRSWANTSSVNLKLLVIKILE